MKIENDPTRYNTLVKYAKDLGCSLYGMSDARHPITELDLIDRIRGQERSIREHRLWIAAVVSSVASLVSALAAWCAILRNP